MASEMVGEVLKLAIAVGLVAVFSMGVYALLPDERIPHLEIEMNFNNSNPEIIDLTHVGGDSINVHDTYIELSNSSSISYRKDYKLTELTSEDYWKFSETLHLNASANMSYYGANVSIGNNTNASGIIYFNRITVIHQRGIIAAGEVH
jgi:FlaG/FlaF family flagellin (archaellin)